MKKIIFVLIVLTGFISSCTKNFDDFNTDKKRPTEVPGDFLFANAQKALGDQIASTNVNLNIFKLWAQYWTETTYTDEANYDIVTRTIADLTFRTMYRDILKDLAEARKVIEAEAALTEDEIVAKQNRLHIITMVEAYSYNYLLETFGDIPYSEALNIEDYSPKYDDAKTVYLDLLSRLKDATDGLVLTLENGDDAESFGDNDLYFDGDVASWKKFGNSMRIKMAITLSDVDETVARENIEAAYASGAFDMRGEGAFMVYPGGSNANPLHLDMVASGRNDFVPANTIVDIMNDLNDPRRDDYFNANGDTYRGGIYGETSPFAQLSHVADPILEETFPVNLLDYVEVKFYLAEAAARGFSVGGTAEEHYNEAITASILHWNGTQEDADTLLMNSEVAFSAADWKEKIGTQAWLAFYTRGLEGYTIWRRLDYPIFNIAPTLDGDYDLIPKRFTYPINEQTLNADNYAAAASAIGGDDLTTRLFWDVN